MERILENIEMADDDSDVEQNEPLVAHSKIQVRPAPQTLRAKKDQNQGWIDSEAYARAAGAFAEKNLGFGAKYIEIPANT